MKVYCLILPLLLLASALSGCHHKDLIDEATPTGEQEIVFDWTEVPDANPSSMGAYLYGDNQEDVIRFMFSGRDGGPVKLPIDHYCGIAINTDNASWLRMRNHKDADRFELYTDGILSLPVSGYATRSVPQPGNLNESMVSPPQMIWATRTDDLTVESLTENKKLVFRMDEAVCHYTVDILEVKNIKSLDSSGVDGTLSGMAAGWHPGRKRASDTHATLPFILKADKAAGTFHAEFLTFGENPNHSYPHSLTVYLILKDGSKRYYTFDVADQITSAADPRHVHIVVRGLDLPDSVSGDGGLNPDVNDWEEEDIDISM